MKLLVPGLAFCLMLLAGCGGKPAPMPVPGRLYDVADLVLRTPPEKRFRGWYDIRQANMIFHRLDQNTALIAHTTERFEIREAGVWVLDACDYRPNGQEYTCQTYQDNQGRVGVPFAIGTQGRLIFVGQTATTSVEVYPYTWTLRDDSGQVVRTAHGRFRYWTKSYLTPDGREFHLTEFYDDLSLGHEEDHAYRIHVHRDGALVEMRDLPWNPEARP